MKPRLSKVSRWAGVPAGRIPAFSTLILAALTLVTVLFLEAAPAAAQFQQYTPPGQNRRPSTSLKDDLERDVADARWKLGALRLQPQLKVHNLTFVNDVFVGTGQEQSDFTATLGLGLTAYLPVGPKSTVVAFGLPEYVWWQDQAERRQLNESYGIGVFSYFNRLSMELSGSRLENQGFASSEVEQLVTATTESLGANFALQLARSLWLEVSGQARTNRFLSPEEKSDSRVARFDRLDREENLYRVGLRVDLRGDWSVGAGVEQSEISFLDPSNNLSNSGTAPYLVLDRVGGRADLAFDVAFRSLDPDGSSTFRPFQEVTGSAELLYHLRPTLDLAITESRQLIYSVSEDFSYSLSQRTGLQLRKSFQRITVEVFYEVGDLAFATAAIAAVQRVDDYLGWGSKVDVNLWKRASLRLGAEVTDYDSNLPGFDRSVTRWTTSFSFGEAAWP